MNAVSPTVLRIGWRRSWLAPHVRRRLLAGALAAAGVVLALSSVHPPVAAPPHPVSPGAAVSPVSGLAPGLVAAPVRLADADVAPLLHVGMRVNVLVAGSTGETGLPASGKATVVAQDVRILAVQPAQNGPASSANTSGGTLVVLAVTSSDARALAGGEASGRLSVTLLGG
jgi:pilus assembly protein CpaB